MNETKDGKGIVFLCALIAFFMCVVVAGYASVFGFLPEYVNSDLVSVSFATSIFGIASLLSSLIAAPLYRKIGAKTAILICCALLTIYGLALGTVPSIPVMYVVFAFSGFANAVGILTAMGDILVKKFGAEASNYMSIVVGGVLLGCGAGQGVAGIVYDHLGMRLVFLVVFAGSGIISFVLTLFVKEEKAVPIATAADAGQTAKSGNSIFRNPKAWVFWIITAICNGLTLPILNYSTLYFPEFGHLTISTTATVVSLLSICSGIYNLFLNGKVLQKLGAKTACIIIFICMAGVSAFAILYAGIPAMWVLVLMIICYAVGATSSSLHAIVAPIIFGPTDSTEAMTKAGAFQGIGSIIYPVVYANIVTARGISPVFTVAVVMSIICAAGYILLFSIFRKKTDAFSTDALLSGKNV